MPIQGFQLITILNGLFSSPTLLPWILAENPLPQRRLAMAGVPSLILFQTFHLLPRGLTLGLLEILLQSLDLLIQGFLLFALFLFCLLYRILRRLISLLLLGKGRNGDQHGKEE